MLAAFKWQIHHALGVDRLYIGFSPRAGSVGNKLHKGVTLSPQGYVFKYARCK